MKKLVSLFLSSALLIGTVLTGGILVEASDEPKFVDGSYLLDDATESVGMMESSTWGYYLKNGTSSIVEKGSGLIGVGGSTTGQRIVDKISVTVVVQRQVNGSWQNYLTFMAEETNSAYASASRLLTVPKGYYYRVCCSHYASTDTGYSNTNALLIK